jgi:hypothetical protein
MDAVVLLRSFEGVYKVLVALSRFSRSSEVGICAVRSCRLRYHSTSCDTTMLVARIS